MQMSAIIDKFEAEIESNENLNVNNVYNMLN
jgi:hypothetical protein